MAYTRRPRHELRWMGSGRCLGMVEGWAYREAFETWMQTARDAERTGDDRDDGRKGEKDVALSINYKKKGLCPLTAIKSKGPTLLLRVWSLLI